MPISLPTHRHHAKGLTGRHVLLAMVAFFGVIFAVNGVLFWKAIATHSGLVANEPYRKGLHYNQRIDADAAQQALGWSERLTLAGDRSVVLTLSERSGKPVSGLIVLGVLGRPATVSLDTKLSFIETTPGTYVAERPEPLAPGAWLLSLEAYPSVIPAGVDAGSAPAAGSTPPIWRLKRRLWLKP